LGIWDNPFGWLATPGGLPKNAAISKLGVISWLGVPHDDGN
jgi:hypothetical protein